MSEIREIDPFSEAEILLVASRMRQTLIEVLGVERGTGLYTMEWLVDRVRWHLDSSKTTAKVFVFRDKDDLNVAHAIARIEHSDSSDPFGYFSTIYVEPEYRNLGVASKLITHVESWFQSLSLPKIVYNTAGDHAKLIRLFERHGYKVAQREGEMIQLIKALR